MGDATLCLWNSFLFGSYRPARAAIPIPRHPRRPPVHSCLIDGEAIISDATGLAVFSLVRNYRNGPRATLCAFDLIEIDGEDLRWQPIEDRKAALKKLLSRSHPGIAFNKHFDVEGTVVFHHACKLGCEGIVSKRLGSPYRFGRSNDWLKIKNPAAPAVRREAEEDWGGKRKAR